MALQLPTIVSDPRVQQNLDFLARQWPVAAQHLSDVFVRKVAELPESGKAAQVVFNEADNKLYCHDGSEWKALF
jgi:hypothetical protein